MLLSFSVPEMLPFVEAGIRQALGEDVGAARVKRQTYRKRGARGTQLLEHAREAGNTIPYDLHLYWKSRTPQCRMLGTIPCRLVKVYPVEILHSWVQPTHTPDYQCIRLDGPRGWRRGDATCFWAPGDADNGFCREAHADGFDSPEAFRDFFAPNRGDRFEAILFKW